jgi:hypothetical protein
MAVRPAAHTRDEIKTNLRRSLARDDLRGDFAGHENKGPAKKQKSKSRSTNLKSRMTEKSKSRTPVR